MTAIALGPDTDVTASELCLAGDETCDVAGTCIGCDKVICPNHCDEFTTCVDNEDLFHCLDCRFDCVECRGASAEDAYEASYELGMRGDF